LVDFDVQHEFRAAPDAVATGMTDSAFTAGLALPDLAPTEVLDRTENADGVTLRARFRFVGSLDPLARRILSGDRISWVQEVMVDPTKRAGTLTVRSDVQADRLQCSGHYRLEPLENGGTRRRLHGSLSIKVPLIGSRAERHILPGLITRVDLEAAALDEWLAAPPNMP
jgi:hypothetical protein